MLLALQNQLGNLNNNSSHVLQTLKVERKELNRVPQLESPLRSLIFWITAPHRSRHKIS
jgi:hypothetical protein